MENISTSLFIRNPGLRTLPPGIERYFVRGGGLSVIEVLPEDNLIRTWANERKKLLGLEEY